MTNTVMALFVAPAVEPRMAGILLLLLGLVLLVAAILARREYKRTGETVLRALEIVLLILASICFSAGRRRLWG
jgi:uncharacterized membrane protein HdeD (DUF308 family)